jgi:rubrerythrin
MKKNDRSDRSSGVRQASTLKPNGGRRSGRNRVNEKWLKNFISEMLATEQGGVQLYERALDQLEHDELRIKLKQYCSQTQRHVELCETMLEAAGGESEEKSPGAEATEQKAQGLMSVEVPVEMTDINNIENIVLAETKDLWNWMMLSSVMDQIKDDKLKKVVGKAVREVERQERDHVGWNQKTLTKLATEAARQPEQMDEGEENEDAGR